jgi:DNA polymerase V
MTRGGKRDKAGRPRGSGKYQGPTKAIRVPVHKLVAIESTVAATYDLPLYQHLIPAGFPSPADDFLEERINLNTLLVQHPSATFFVKVSGNSMIDAGIHDKDLLIVDRSLTPCHGKIVIAAVNGELTVKRLLIQDDKVILMPENPEFSPLEISKDTDFRLWGVVTNVIHPV